MLLGPLKGCLTRDAKLAACSDFKAAFGMEEQFTLQVQGGKEEVCWRQGCLPEVSAPAALSACIDTRLPCLGFLGMQLSWPARDKHE